MKKSNPEEAQALFDKAKYHMERADDLYFFVYMIFAIEQSAFYKEKGDMDNFKKVLNKCIDHFKKHGCNEKADRLFAILNNKNVATKKIGSGLKKISSFQLIELARRVGSEMELDRQNMNIRFLSSWQKLMNSDTVENVQALYGGDEVVTDYTEKNTDISSFRINSIVDFFRSPQQPFVITRTEKRFYDYSKFISNFGINQVFSILCVPLYDRDELTHLFIGYIHSHDNFVHNYKMLDEDDLNILRFTFRQLIDSTRRLKARLEIQEMNAKLEKTSVTDMLTGLLNRQGFSKYLDEEFDKLAAKKRTREIPTTVLYIDLDNFKFYNDTFGHDIGDVLLVSFSKLFKDIVGDTGYSVRYGGDEFLVILPDADAKEGERVAQAIYKKLDDSNGFEGEIKSKMGHDFEVPKNRRVNCSIGIATSQEASMNAVSEALKCADSALYVVKKSTKGNYRIYQGESREDAEKPKKKRA